MKMSHFTMLIEFLSSLVIATSKVCNNCEGTDFVLVFPENKDSIPFGVISVHISTTSDVPANVRVFSPRESSMNLTLDKEVQVRRQNITTIEVPDDFRFLGNEISFKSIRVTSDREIFVYAADVRQYSGDMFLACPTNKLGQNYIIASHESDINVNVNVPVVAVAAIKNDTLVRFQFKTQITIVFTSGSTFSGNVYDIVLGEYEVVHIKHFELSGTAISASKDIVVVSGSAFLRDASFYGLTTGDYVAEQLTPWKYMSKKYIVVPSALNDTDSGEIVRIYSTEDETNILREYNGISTSYHLSNAGDYLDLFLILSSASVFTADHEIFVVQFGVASMNYGDFYMLLTTPVTAYMQSYVFLTLTNYIYDSVSHRLVIISNKLAIESTFLDSTQLNSTEWNSVGEYFFINVAISEGTHIVHTLAEGGKLWGYVYGRRLLFGYASSIGRYVCEKGSCPGDGPQQMSNTGNYVETTFKKIEGGTKPNATPLTTYYTTLIGCGRACQLLSNCDYFTYQEQPSNMCKIFSKDIWCYQFESESGTYLYEKIDELGDMSSPAGISFG